MERLIAKMGINFKNGPTPYRGAVAKPAKRRLHAFSAVAFLAAVAFGLLFLLPGGLLQAQETYMMTVDYDENDTSSVLTLTAEDPERASPIIWSLLDNATGDQDIPGVGTADDDDVGNDDIADRALFDIGPDGVLEFKSPPNYEATGTDNEHKVVVQASDGTRMNWFKVTVNVMDLEEDGAVKLRPTTQTATTLLQPQVGWI